MEKARLSIPDLTCASCVGDIERSLRAQPGVIWATISFAAREVSVIYDPATFDPLALVRALAELGLDCRLPAGSSSALRGLSARHTRRVVQWMQAR